MIPVFVAEPDSDREEAERDHSQLADFHTDVERDEGRDELARWQAEIAEYGSKTEAVQQAEGKDDKGSPRGEFIGEYVLNRDKDDGRRDQWFHDAAGHIDVAKRAKRQRDGVGEREHSGLQQQRAQLCGQEE